MSQIKAILWDLDGTLINSEDIYKEQLNSILSSRFGKGPLTKDVISKIQGRPGLNICEILVKEFDLENQISGADFYAITNKAEELIRYEACTFLPGIQEFLYHVKNNHNIPHVIASSTTKLKYNAKVVKLKDQGLELFEVILTGGDQPSLKGKGKPQPYIWLMALNQLNEKLGLKGIGKEIKIHECLIFEDSVSGIRSAISAGGKSVWIPSNWDAVNELSNEELNFLKSNCEAVLTDFTKFEKSKYGW